MKQEKKREDNTGKNSIDKLLEQIQQDKRNLKKSSVFAFSALIAIIVLCIAWFVANTRVSSIESSVSAKNNVPFLLGSTGQRQLAEQQYLKENNKNILIEGQVKNYDKYIEDGEEKKENIQLYTGTSSLAWHLASQENIAPGATGKMDFYLIPQKEGLKSVQIQMSLTGYKENKSNQTAVKITEDNVKNAKKLNNLVNGHVLLFQKYDDTYGYSGWLGESNVLDINAPNNGEFQKDIPYKVTLWWVWPQYFRNYIYTQKTTQNDLFTDKKRDDSRENLKKFVNEQKSFGDNGKLFYSKDTQSGETAASSNIDDKMSDEVLDECNKYYNLADEFIGNNVDYVYVEMKVN